MIPQCADPFWNVFFVVRVGICRKFPWFFAAKQLIHYLPKEENPCKIYILSYLRGYVISCLVCFNFEIKHNRLTNAWRDTDRQGHPATQNKLPTAVMPVYIRILVLSLVLLLLGPTTLFGPGGYSGSTAERWNVVPWSWSMVCNNVSMTKIVLLVSTRVMDSSKYSCGKQVWLIAVEKLC